MKILIGILIAWSIFNSFVSITALLASKMNYEEIEAIKSWYPFCEILKMKIPNKGGEQNDSEEKR